MVEMVKVTEKIVDEMLRDYNKGLSQEKLSIKLNVSKCLVYYYLKKYDIEVRRPLWKMNEVKKIINFYKLGITVKEIALRFNKTENTIWQLLIRKKINFNRKKPKFSNEQFKEILTQYLHGRSSYKNSPRI